MKRLSRHAVFLSSVAALVMATASPPASAGEDMTPSEQTSVIATVVVLIPVFASVGSVASVVGPVLEGVRGSSQRATEPLPKMKVAEVRDTPQGGREVELVTLEGEDQGKALLAWPRREDDPAAGFKVGQTIEFLPAQGGSGWLVSAGDGKALAFLPVATAAQQVHSKTW